MGVSKTEDIPKDVSFFWERDNQVRSWSTKSDFGVPKKISPGKGLLQHVPNLPRCLTRRAKKVLDKQIMQKFVVAFGIVEQSNEVHCFPQHQSSESAILMF